MSLCNPSSPIGATNFSDTTPECRIGDVFLTDRTRALEAYPITCGSLSFGWGVFADYHNAIAPHDPQREEPRHLFTFVGGPDFGAMQPKRQMTVPGTPTPAHIEHMDAWIKRGATVVLRNAEHHNGTADGPANDDTMAAVRCIVLELDSKGSRTAADKLAAVLKILKPTTLHRSSRANFHLRFRLKPKAYPGPGGNGTILGLHGQADIEEIREVAFLLARAFDGDTGATGAAQGLRAPGSWNLKGVPWQVCDDIGGDPAAEYSLDELKAILATVEPMRPDMTREWAFEAPAGTKPVAELKDDDAIETVIDRWRGSLRRRIETGNLWPFNGRNELLFNTVGRIIGEGVPPHVVRTMVADFANDTGLGAREVKDTLHSACQDNDVPKLRAAEAARRAASVDRIDGNLSVAEAVEKINQRHAYITSLDRVMDLSTIGTDHLLFMEPAHFVRALNTKLYIPDADKPEKVKVINAAKAWLEHKKRRSFSRLDFLAGGEPGVLDLFQGFKVQAREGDWHLLEHHIRHVLCHDNDEWFRFIMTWCADIFQNPADKKPVTVVVRGKEGSGKGTVFKDVLCRLLGTCAFHALRKESVIGKFNKQLANKLFVFADETTWGGDRESAAILKGMISETTHNIEPKGVDTFTMRSCYRIAMATNEGWAISATEDSRRFFVLDAMDPPETREAKAAYFGPLHHEINNGGREAFLHALLEWKPEGGFDRVLRNPPHTEFMEAQKQITQDAHEHPWTQLLGPHLAEREGKIRGPSILEWLGFKPKEQTQAHRRDLGDVMRAFGYEHWEARFDLPYQQPCWRRGDGTKEIKLDLLRESGELF